MYTTLMRELELESNDFNFSFQCMMTLFFILSLPSSDNSEQNSNIEIQSQEIFSITSSKSAVFEFI
jgi:hypothetical protein